MTELKLPLDTEKVRAFFPAFSQDSLKSQAFFENAGGSYTSNHVLQIFDKYYRETKVQPYGAFDASERAGKAMDLAYERIAAALGLGDEWIHFGPSTSANAYVLSHAFSEQMTSGDAIVVTNQDHEANSGFWRRMAENQGVEIREWTFNSETGHLDLNDLANLLDNKVRFVAFPHCSNIIGEINPAQEICKVIQQAGAISIVDGVSYAPHGLPDVGEIGADIYFFSAYKTFGPHVGVMAIRPELAQSLPVQGHHFNSQKLRYRLTPAGPDHAQIAAMAGVAEYLTIVADLAKNTFDEQNSFRRAHAAMRTQETILLQPLLDFLSARNDMRLIGPSLAENRAPTVSIGHNVPGFEMAQRLSKHGIMAGGGDFYAQRTLQGLGLDPEHGVLRLSFTHYISPAEIDQLIEALAKEF